MKEFFEVLNKMKLAIITICVVGFISVLMLGAAARLPGYSLNWCNDVVLFMLVWITLLGSDVAFRAGRMVNVDILTAKLSARFQEAAAVMVYVVLLVMMFMMVKRSVLLCANVGRRTLEGIPFLNYVWVVVFIPVGFSLMFTTVVKCLYDPMVSSDTTVISKM